MWLFVLLAFGGALLGYAIYTQYSATDASFSTPKRVWASVVAAVAALAAAATSWVHGVTTP